MKYSSKPKQPARTGFTLIELLIVIAIIALLASILFPVFGRARENARRASCQSNLQQIGLGIRQYLQDYDERYPIDDTDDPSTVGWAYIIQPYIQSEQIFQCPSDSNVLPTAATRVERANQIGFTDYWYNGNFVSATYGPGIADSQVTFPSTTVMNGDGAGGKPGDIWTQGPTLGQVRHFDGANYSFADGHVKWLLPEKLHSGTGSNCAGGPSTPDGNIFTYCTY